MLLVSCILTALPARYYSDWWDHTISKFKFFIWWEIAHQFSSVTQLWRLCDPMDCSTPGLPVHHQLSEFAQAHVHWVGDAIQPPHPLSSPSPPVFYLSQHQSLFKWVSSSHQVAHILAQTIAHIFPSLQKRPHATATLKAGSPEYYLTLENSLDSLINFCLKRTLYIAWVEALMIEDLI